MPEDPLPQDPISDDEYADELARFHRELTGVDDDREGVSVRNPESTKSSPSRTSDPLESAKRVIELLARTKPQVGGVTDTIVNEPISDTPSAVLTREGRLCSLDIPSTIGRFEVISLLGQGGFGLVFLAQDPKLDRKVAIKVPQLGSLLDTEAQLRFNREGRALATLNHPGIVPIYEVGSDGPIAYITSEYVPGLNLAEFVKVNGRLEGRLAARMIADLADAIQHAHSRGVIHRDLKPANVLFQLDDPTGFQETRSKELDITSGTVRVTDFGLAKLLEEVDQEVTQTGSVLGTPAFSAPEQLHSTPGVETTVAVDVYSLGAVLYFLVTGQAPFESDRIVQTIQDVQHLAPLPPQERNPLVPDDLSAICLACLEKSPSDRYATAHELKQDLERYLSGEPVVACPLPAHQRLWRWSKRNRAIAVSAGVALFAVVGGLVVSLLMARNAQQAALAAKLAEEHAKIEATTAVEVSDFLIDLFRAPDSLGARQGSKRGRELTAESILQRGATKVRQSLKDQPAVQARLMSVIGRVCVNLGMYDDAESLLTEALALQQSRLVADDPQLAADHYELGRALTHLNQFDAARTHLEKAIQLQEQDIVANHEKLTASLNALGVLLMDVDYPNARSVFERARELVVDYKGRDHDSLWSLDANIASLDAKNGEFELARAKFEVALASAERALGTDHPRLGALVGNLAFVEKKLGNYRAARRLQERDLQLTELRLGKEHPTLVAGLINLVQISQRLGELDSAKAYGERMIELAKIALPDNHRHVCIALNTHAGTLTRLSDYDSAKKLLEQSCAANQLGGFQDRELVVKVKLADVERLDGNTERSVELIKQVLSHAQIEEFDGTALDAQFVRTFVLAQTNAPDASEHFRLTLRFAESTRVQPAVLAFKEAQYYALSNQHLLAITKIEQAIELGFRDAGLLTNPDLASIQLDDRFQKLTERWSKHD